ncbi:hypothetical protein ACX53_00295 [Loigolactobacillus backii]|nr:hypothetical protein ACX53_00295 [Loigolactobacillus backii]
MDKLCSYCQGNRFWGPDTDADPAITVEVKQQTINDLTSKLEATKQTNNDLSQAIEDAQSIKDYSNQAVKSVNAKREVLK